MDLTKKKLPSFVEIEGNLYNINTDFRIILKFAESIIEGNGHADLIILNEIYLGKLPKDTTGKVLEYEATEAILQWMNPPHELPRKTSDEGTNEVLIDYKLDADLIYSAFMQEYKIDLFEVDLHYYKFKALMSGLKNSKLVDIIGYRQYTPSGKTDEYEKRKAELYEAWRIIPEAEKKATEEATSRFEAWLEGKRK